MLTIAYIIDWLSYIISEYIYVGVFIAALSETVFTPIPTIVIFTFVGYIAFQNEFSLVELVLLGIIGGLGSTIGSLILYFFALKLGTKTRLLKYLAISEKKLNLISKWIDKYGSIIVFICRLIPILREAVSIFAGIFKMKKIIFFVYTFLGSSILNIILLFIGYYFNGNFQSFIKTYF
ncbi:MAG: DedA family protein [Thaumarchaeota archaeon]|nr:DedA family protein [Nitrososphaerota archaeon]